MQINKTGSEEPNWFERVAREGYSMFADLVVVVSFRFVSILHTMTGVSLNSQTYDWTSNQLFRKSHAQLKPKATKR